MGEDQVKETMSRFTENEIEGFGWELTDALSFLRMLNVYALYAEDFDKDNSATKKLPIDARVCLEHVIPVIDRIAGILGDGFMEKTGGAV